jgi:hypothetical protein
MSPATGWMFAAACGVRARGARPMRQALLAIAVGHAASIALVAWAVAQGMAMDRGLVRGLAGALLVGAAAYRWLCRARQPVPIGTQVGHTGIALWSFLMATAHGAGLMLVPAFVPLCLADTPARDITASGSLIPALAAVGLHTATMLATTGVVAAGVCRGVALHPRLSGGTVPRQTWTAALAVTGVLLMALR